MTQPTPLYFDDLSLDMTLTSTPYTITEEEIIDFARRWDPQPFHIDPEQAKTSEFGGLIACGMHVNCIRSLLCHHLPAAPVVAAGLAANKTLLPHPVYPGDTLMLSVRIAELRPSGSRPHLGIVVADHVLRNQAERTVLQLEAVILTPLRGGN